MGAWGIGNFENDDALDFVGTLAETTGDKALVQSFKIVSKKKSRAESYECAEALAAAEVVAALYDKPNDLPEELEEWVADNKHIGTPELLAAARATVKIIMQKSELRLLWEESGSLDEWKLELESLLSRLE